MAYEMQIGDRPLLSASIRERDIDLVVVQLVQTSPPFRRWFRDQFATDSELEEFLGVSHSVGTIHGETDIEIGFETLCGNRHLLMVENKIDASFQENQPERYYKRGEKHVENGFCDEYSVGLIAPEGYVGESTTKSFDTVVSYEAILSQLESISHDGVPFFESLIELAIDKQVGEHNAYPALTGQIRRRFFDRADEFPEIVPSDTSDNLVRFHSTHPDHPSAVSYSVWVRGDNYGKQTMVRLGIDSDAPSDEIRDLQTRIAEDFDELDGFELREDSTMYTVRTHVGTESSEQEYVDEIVSTLRALVAFYHPRLVAHKQ